MEDKHVIDLTEQKLRPVFDKMKQSEAPLQFLSDKYDELSDKVQQQPIRASKDRSKVDETAKMSSADLPQEISRLKSEVLRYSNKIETLKQSLNDHEQ